MELGLFAVPLYWANAHAGLVSLGDDCWSQSELGKDFNFISEVRTLLLDEFAGKVLFEKSFYNWLNSFLINAG